MKEEGELEEEMDVSLTETPQHVTAGIMQT